MRLVVHPRLSAGAFFAVLPASVIYYNTCVSVCILAQYPNLHKCICVILHLCKCTKADIITSEGGETMPLSEAKKKANKKWNDAHLKERYDRLQLVLPAGQKATVEAAAQAAGESVNLYTQKALLARMGLENWPVSKKPCV